MLHRVLAVAAALALAHPVASLAQAEGERPAACAATDAALPVELSAWTAKASLVAAAGSDELSRAEVRPGQAVSVALPLTRAVTYVVQPEKPGGSVSHGGLLSLRIGKAGTYRIALDSGAWIDLIKDGAAASSTAHGRGPPCSTVRKMVDFALTPGRYVIQISANADPSIGLLVAAAP